MIVLINFMWVLEPMDADVVAIDFSSCMRRCFIQKHELLNNMFLLHILHSIQW